MNFFRNVKRRLITTLAVLLVIGFAATSFFNYFVSRSVIRDSIVASKLPSPAVERIEGEALTGIRRALYLNLFICLVISLIVLAATSVMISRYQRQLEEMATTDKLTGLANRQAFELLAPQAIREAQRAKTPLLAILIDIDHFKEVNDRLGHLAGDSVIQQVGRRIKSTLRQSDIVCRWGGEEFLVVVKVSDDGQGEALAEKLRSAVENAEFRVHDKVVRITISIGISRYREGEMLDQGIARADQVLYAAKGQGRNRVLSADMPARPLGA